MSCWGGATDHRASADLHCLFPELAFMCRTSVLPCGLSTKGVVKRGASFESHLLRPPSWRPHASWCPSFPQSSQPCRHAHTTCRAGPPPAHPCQAAQPRAWRSDARHAIGRCYRCRLELQQRCWRRLLRHLAGAQGLCCREAHQPPEFDSGPPVPSALSITSSAVR